jgi:hypothetical protein
MLLIDCSLLRFDPNEGARWIAVIFCSKQSAALLVPWLEGVENQTRPARIDGVVSRNSRPCCPFTCHKYLSLVIMLFQALFIGTTSNEW